MVETVRRYLRGLWHRPWPRRIAIASLAGLLLTAAAAWILPSFLAGPALVEASHRPAAPDAPPLAETDVLRVMTFNIAHGRGTGSHQAWRHAQDLDSNVRRIGDLLVKWRPHLVALQEVDRPSWWSGGSDQLAVLERYAVAYRAEGRHVQGLGLHYGAALLSRMPIHESYSLRFPVRWPTWPKGYVAARVHWPGHPDRRFTVVSVHLDFASDARREEQTSVMIDHLRREDRPLIVMGDLNAEHRAGSPVQRLMQELDLHTWRATTTDADPTFPGLDSRIDWILVSSSFEILDYRVLRDAPSDHRPVVMDLAWTPSDQSPAADSIAPGR